MIGVDFSNLSEQPFWLEQIFSRGPFWAEPFWFSSVRLVLLVQPFAVLLFCSWPLGPPAFLVSLLSLQDQLFWTRVLSSQDCLMWVEFLRNCILFYILVVVAV